MKQYKVTEAELRTFVEESILLEVWMEEDPPLDKIKAQICSWENESWDDIVDAALARFLAGRGEANGS